MDKIKDCLGVTEIIVDKEESELMLIDSDKSHIPIDLNHIQLMHVLDKFTDEDVDATLEAYGVDTEEMPDG